MTFEKKFWELWFQDQTEKEQKEKWLPSKRPAQVVEEFLEYLRIVSVIKRPSVLEIGVAQGHQRRFYEKLLKCRRYFSIDIDENSPALIRGNSQDPAMVGVINVLEPDGWDIIFVDGNHSREGVKADYETYGGMVKPGGFIALHDTHHDHWDRVDGAAVLWLELQKRFKNQIWDIYHEADYTPMPGQKGTTKHKQCGIGVIQL